MPRKPRLVSTEHAYHIIARGNNRQQIFFGETDYQRFLFFIKRLKAEFPFDLYHYCLMPNHAHLLMRFPSENSFRKVPHRLFLLYAKHYARSHTHIGHVFQDRFKSFLIPDDGYLLECGRYIERNPLKAGMVAHPRDYRWSSYAFYEGNRRDDFLSENPLYPEIGGRFAYEKYVVTARPYEEAVERLMMGKVSP